jgi:L-alanine-DL-glutamate epimerase-like enolase superfamily enzyme
MPITIESYFLTRLAFPRDRVIGDSQVRADTMYLGALELSASNGLVGTGFFGTLFHALPSLEELNRVFEAEIKGLFIGQNPFTLTNRLARPRGGNIRALPYGIDEAIDQAVWDLKAQALEMPLYRLLGGTHNRVPAYASGLEFHLSDAELIGLYGQAANLGFRAFKAKIGHPDLDWDIHRLELVRKVVGERATLMIDANEAWSPAEAIRRLHAYHRAGIEILWIEDPCLRYDFDGLREVARATPFTLLNTGEYLGLGDKRRLMEAGAVDILNIHGHFTNSLRAAWLAGEHGLPVSIGNTNFELGVHLAAALPGGPWMEYSFPNWNEVVMEPVRFEGGYALAPEVPGHGMRLSAAARTTYAQPNVEDVSGMTPPPSILRQRPDLPPRS